jgi:hypothetical protein
MLTLREIFEASFAFADSNDALIFGLSLAVPIVGIVLAWIGRGGRSQEDGKAFANAFVFAAVVQFVVAMIGGYVGVAFLERSLLDTSLLLLVAPWVWLTLSVFGLRLIFPLSELTSWRSILDVGAFFAVSAALIWFLSMFRGWGVLFFGSLVQLVLILAFAAFLLRQLFVRAFRAGGT